MNKSFCVLLKIFLIYFIFAFSLYSQDKPAKGYIQHIAIDYSETNIVYAAVIGQGLMKSTDYGESWKIICDKAFKKEFQVVKVDPKNPRRILAGGEKSGLLLSDNKGNSWVQIGLKNVSICDIAIDEKNPKRVFVLADEGIYSNQDIEKEDWTLCLDRVEYVKKLNNSDKRLRFWDYTRFQKLAISPHNPNTIIAATRWEGGYHRSDDGGKTWENETISGIYRRADLFYFHPKDPDVIYAGTHHQGLFKTFNNGKSWVPHGDGLRAQPRMPYYGAYLISGFTADKNNPDLFYSGSDFSNWKSTDGGLNWTELDKSLTCEFVRAMAIDPKNPDIVYAGSNIGLYKTTNAGKHWKAINNGLIEANIKKNISVTTPDGEIQFCLSEDYPFVYRKEKEENWKSSSWLLAEYGLKKSNDLYYDDNSKLLVLVADKGNYTSEDYGYRWKGKDSEIPFAKVKSEVKELKLSKAPDYKKSYALSIELTGEIFFDHMLVDTFYRKPPYISLQVIEEGYPFNKSIPAFSINIDDYLKSEIEIPKSAIDPSKKYFLYAEVRDFQKNFKTAIAKINFVENKFVPITMELQEGLCLKKWK